MFKRILSFFVVFLIICMFSLSVGAEAVNTYNVAATGVSFNIPQGWKESPLSEEREFIKVKYEPESEDGASIQFGYADIWGELPDSDKVGSSRSDITHSAVMDSFTEQEILEMMGYDSLGAEIDSVYYNSNEYLEITVDTELSIFDVSTDITMITLFHFDNGYAYMFMYGDMAEKSHYHEFEAMMNGVKYPLVNKTDNETVDIDIAGDLQFNFINLIVSLIFTIVVYSLPIIIYRYGIKKQALPAKKAKKITIIYGIIAFFVMAFLIGGAPGAAIILWSSVNYKILTTQNKNDIGLKYEIPDNKIVKENILTDVNEENSETTENEVEDNETFVGGFVVKEIEEFSENKPVIQTAESKIKKSELKPPISTNKTNEIKNSSKALFCRKCGARLLEDSKFCYKCGLRVIKKDIK